MMLLCILLIMHLRLLHVSAIGVDLEPKCNTELQAKWTCVEAKDKISKALKSMSISYDNPTSEDLNSSMCYHYFDTRVTFLQALSICNAVDGRIPLVMSEPMIMLMEKLRTNHGPWIGLQQSTYNRSWSKNDRSVKGWTRTCDAAGNGPDIDIKNVEWCDGEPDTHRYKSAGRIYSSHKCIADKDVNAKWALLCETRKKVPDTTISIAISSSVTSLPPTIVGTSGLPPTTVGTSGLPPTTAGTSGLPPTTVGTSGLPPTTAGTSGLPPTTVGTSGLPPTTVGTSGLPPTTAGTSGLPPTTVGISGLPPTTVGTSGLPPTTAGTSGLPPTTAGTSGLPPTTVGTSGLPPTTAGTSGLPLTTAGTSGLPPTTVGTSGLPPTTVGTSGLPPTTVGTSGLPPTTVGTSGFPPTRDGTSGSALPPQPSLTNQSYPPYPTSSAHTTTDESNATQTTKGHSSNDSSNLLLFVGIGCGCLLLVVLVTIVFIVKCRRTGNK